MASKQGMPLGNGSSESVQEFAACINELGTQIFQSSNLVLTTSVRNANDQLLQSGFISRLRIDIRRFVLERDPNTLEESINFAFIEEQNLKLNEVASIERSGLSSLPTESPVISALTDKLQELKLRVKSLKESSTVIARETSKGEFHRKLNVLSVFIVAWRAIDKQNAESESLTSVLGIPPWKC
ncbi:hypothetical protein TNCV_3696101 [Trichonephila clavipes]|nr:hypothetical protein TNCV_3696101 [Trichonephila clavipes]